MAGIKAYKKNDYLKAAALFAESSSEVLYQYESKFNQATSLFKLGKFKESHRLFNNLLATFQDTQ